MKKLISLFLSAAMLLSVAQLPVFAVITAIDSTQESSSTYPDENQQFAEQIAEAVNSVGLTTETAEETKAEDNSALLQITEKIAGTLESGIESVIEESIVEATSESAEGSDDSVEDSTMPSVVKNNLGELVASSAATSSGARLYTDAEFLNSPAYKGTGTNYKGHNTFATLYQADRSVASPGLSNTQTCDNNWNVVDCPHMVPRAFVLPMLTLHISICW